MNFNTVLNLRTESAGQRGIVILQFLPQEAIGAPQLTMSVAPAVAAALEVGETYQWTASRVDPAAPGQGTAGSTISFRAVLNLRTESAAQAGTAELQFVPEASVGVPQLTMRVSLDVSSGLVVGATYLFEASHVEPQVQVESEAA